VQFLNAYLQSKGEEPSQLDRFRTLASSQATGAQPIGQAENLMQPPLTQLVTRYRGTKNPDLGASCAGGPDVERGTASGHPQEQ